MRYSFGFICVLAFGVMPLVGCGETSGGGGNGGTADTGSVGGTGGTTECRAAEDCTYNSSCATGAKCIDGECIPTPRIDAGVCAEDFNQCTDDVCVTGVCEHVVFDDGTACDEDNECTVMGACAKGECITTPVEDGTTCGGGVGTCQAGRCSGTFACTEAGIREAIAVGGGPHTFECNGPTSVVLNAGISIDNDVILDGEGNLILEASRIQILGAVVALSRMTLRRGRGLLNSEGKLALDKVTISDNYCSGQCGSGGIFNDGGELTLTDSVLSNNDGEVHFGAIFNVNQARLTVRRSTVSGDALWGVASLGGGDVVIEDSVITANNRGIYICSGSIATIVNSTISGNDFSAIVTDTSTMALDSTIEGPIAPSAAVDRCAGGESRPVKFQRTLINGNCEVEGTSDGYNIESPGNTCGFDTNKGDQVDVTAEQLNLGPLQDNGGPTMTHALLPGSVAIDQIPEEDCVDADGEPLTTDQRGAPRPQGPACDVGAFELEVAP